MARARSFACALIFAFPLLAFSQNLVATADDSRPAIPAHEAAIVAPEHTRPPIPRHEFSIWSAESFGNGHAFGDAQDRSLAFVALRYARSVGNLGPVNFRYVIEARPVAYLGDLHPVNGHLQRTYVYSGGFSPIGVEMTLAARRRVHPFLASNGGFLYFTDRVLASTGESQFQFTIYNAYGAEFRLNSHESVKIGYLYHHFSNANITGDNYALDTHTIIVGFSWYKK